jgi:two-component sensor histidine kinase
MPGPSIDETRRIAPPDSDDADSPVREAHHRISNHLQILASFIGLQAREHQNAQVREALLDVRRRILTIARLHADLQGARQREILDLSQYLAHLTEQIRASFGAVEDFPLDLDLDPGPSAVKVETAVTLGLIVNELVTNAIKHAMIPKGGRVRVSLHRREDGVWRLTVSDQGPGLDTTMARQAHSDHGLGLIRSMVGRLKGAMSVDSSPSGATISVSFP